MGKYMKSIKKPSPADGNDVVCGVHTRAKALALRNSGGGGGCSYAYIQLRSRPVMKRLKSPPPKPKSGLSGHGPDPKVGCLGIQVKASLDNRTTRETTPCSLVKVPDVARTPESSTRPAPSAKGNCGNSMQLRIPTVNEMDKFFTRAEEEHQRQFIEKYNFDPVNEKPLLGRYEWVRVDPCS